MSCCAGLKRGSSTHVARSCSQSDHRIRFILVVVGASSAIRADEELTLETSALILFTVANLHYQLG